MKALKWLAVLPVVVASIAGTPLPAAGEGGPTNSDPSTATPVTALPFQASGYYFDDPIVPFTDPANMAVAQGCNGGLPLYRPQWFKFTATADVQILARSTATTSSGSWTSASLASVAVVAGDESTVLECGTTRQWEFQQTGPIPVSVGDSVFVVRFIPTLSEAQSLVDHSLLTRIQATLGVVPTNDYPGNARWINPDEPVELTADVGLATLDDAEAALAEATSCWEWDAPENPQPAVWFSYSTSVSESVILDTTGSDYPTTILVARPSMVGASSPSCIGSKPRFSATAGTQYLFGVYGYDYSNINVAGQLRLKVVHRPKAPVDVSAVPGNTQATVTWSPGANDGGSTITGYTATASPGGLTCETTGATSCIVTGLVNGWAYTFTVTATNEVGASDPSSPSAGVTPRTVPAAPTGVTALAFNKSALVQWAPPASDGGAPITGYTVTSTPESLQCTTTGATSCTVAGLSNGTGYTFSVSAQNVAGSSAASAASASVTPNAVPEAAGSVVAVPGDRSVVVSWDPAATEGTPVSEYVVTGTPGGATCATTGATSCPISGLVNGTGYTFTVVASNSLGQGPASAPSNPVTPRTVPSAPTGVVAVAGNAKATVSWTAPDSGGAPITRYLVTAAPGGFTCETGSSTSCVVTGLSNGTAYTFTVTAANVAGVSVPSVASNVVTPASRPGVPTGLSVSGLQITASGVEGWVSWNPPADTGGSPILGYTVSLSDARNWVTGPQTTQLIGGLTPGQFYTVTVTARTAVGTSQASEALRFTATPAGPAASVKAKAKSAKSKLYVDVNPNKGGGYWVFLVQRKQPDGTWQALKTYKTKGSKETRTINLKKGTYRVFVNPKYGYQGAFSAEVYLKK
jgi:hypothetical protein